MTKLSMPTWLTITQWTGRTDEKDDQGNVVSHAFEVQLLGEIEDVCICNINS